MVPTHMVDVSFPIGRVLAILSRASRHWRAPVVSLMAARRTKPFFILVSAALSARTRDETTAAVTAPLFRTLASPRAFATAPTSRLEQLLRPIGFYKTKARHVKKLSQILITKHRGMVPRTMAQLLELPGVGRKTANLVLGEAFRVPAVCVDTHVHRIMNRWGYVKTKTPEQTEYALRKKLPRKWWIRMNPILVSFGQTICQPMSPKCTDCPVQQYCPKIGVKKSR